jgi:hypothetical protein
MLDDAEKVLFQLDDVVTPEVLGAYSVEELARMVLQGRELVRVLRDITGRCEQALVATMPQKKMTVEGIGVLEKTTETSRKEWDHPLLFGRVAKVSEQLRVDPESGEIKLSEAEALLKAITMACRPEWRVTALKELGIDANDFCEVTYGAQKVRITT